MPFESSAACRNCLRALRVCSDRAIRRLVGESRLFSWILGPAAFWVFNHLIWCQRKELARLKRRPGLSGLLFVVCTIGLLLLGSLGAELFLTKIAVVGTVDGLIVYFLGWNFLRALTFPVAFLLLMIPLPVNVYNEIVLPLRLLASCFARSVLDFVN